MAGKIFWGTDRIKKIYWGTTRIKKIYWGTQLVFSDAHVVTYYSDSGAFQTKEVDDGDDCIRNAPTVSKSGYTFVGWRSDRAASATVLPSKTCNADGIVLYAVFKRTLTVTAVGGSSNVTNSGVQFYNTGNVANPSIKLSSNSSLSGWSLVGYRTNTTASTSVSYVANGTYTFSASTTIYAVFSRTLTASFSGNGATGGSTASKTGTQVYNNGNYSNPAITLPASGFTRANAVIDSVEYTYWFSSWGLNGAAYGVGQSYTMTNSVTFVENWGSTAVKVYFGGSTSTSYATIAGNSRIQLGDLNQYANHTLYCIFHRTTGGWRGNLFELGRYDEWTTGQLASVEIEPQTYDQTISIPITYVAPHDQDQYGRWYTAVTYFGTAGGGADDQFVYYKLWIDLA